MVRVIFALICGVAVLALALLVLLGGRDHLRDARKFVSFQRYLRQIEGTLHQSDVMIAMPDGPGGRDGPHLATDVYLPRGVDTGLATILVRLPYGKRRYHEVRRWVDLFLPHGFAIVVQDMRGRWGSQGVFAPYPNAAGDGGATLDWIVDQPWSSGRIGTIGCSALGESQIILAAARHPAHRAMIAIGAGGAIGTARGIHGFFGLFEGAIPGLAPAVGWFSRFGGKTADQMADKTAGARIDPADALSTLPLRDVIAVIRPDPTDFEQMLDMFASPGGFDDWGYISDDDRFAVPTLLVDTWYDPSVQSTLAMAGLIAQSAPSVQTIIAPGTHCKTQSAFFAGKLGDVAISGAARKHLGDTYVAFMSHHLRLSPPSGPSSGPSSGPPLGLPAFTSFVMGEDRWLETAHWPPDRAEAQTWTLSGDRLLTPDQAGGAIQSRSFTSDPRDPVPSIGGAICCTGDPDLRAGPLYQNPIEARPDILQFTSDPMTGPLRIAGPLAARLQVSADVPDTDLVLRLTDVDPEGRSVLIQEGALRLRYRGGFSDPRLMVPGQVYDVAVRMRDIAWLVKPGHRLRLHVAGSSYPRLSLNMNGGGDPHRETLAHPARITIHMSAGAPSSLSLFALPD